MTVAQQTKAIAKLLKGRTFAPPIEGKSLWITDSSTVVKVPLKAYMSKAGNLYFRLNASKKDEQQFCSLGAHYDDMTSFEEGDILMADVATREINKDITPDDLDEMVASTALAGFTQFHADRHQVAMDEGYASLVVLSYDEPE